MQIRPAATRDLENLREIDATIESSEFLHVERSGEGVNVSWKIEQRPLRSKVIDSNKLTEDQMAMLGHLIGGIEEGIALVGEHDDHPIGLVFAQFRHETGTLHIHDLRVDYDMRRQGIGSAMLYDVIRMAREKALRAVSAVTLSNNSPAAQFLVKSSFEITGLDTHFRSNHDLVKETVTLFWHLPLD